MRRRFPPTYRGSDWSRHCGSIPWESHITLTQQDKPGSFREAVERVMAVYCKEQLWTRMRGNPRVIITAAERRLPVPRQHFGIGIMHLSTPERNCIGGRRKNTSRAEVEVGPSQVCGTQTQLSSSISEPAFPSRPGIAPGTARSVGDGRSGATRSSASMASTGPSPQ